MVSLPRHPAVDCSVFWVGVSSLVVLCLSGCAIVDGAPSLFDDSNDTTNNNTPPNNSTANNTTANNTTNNSTSNNVTTPPDECDEEMACGDGEACVLYGESNRCIGVLETPVELPAREEQNKTFLFDLHQETNRLIVATSALVGTTNVDVNLWPVELDNAEIASPAPSQISAPNDGLGGGLTSIATMEDGILLVLQTGESSKGTSTATFLWSHVTEPPIPFSFEYQVVTEDGDDEIFSIADATFTNQEHGAVVATRATDSSFLVAGHLCTQDEIVFNGPCSLKMWELDVGVLSDSIREDTPLYEGPARMVPFDAGAIDDMTAPWQFETNPGPDGEPLHSLIGFYKDNESRNALSYVTFASDETDKEAIASSEAAVDVRLLSPLLANPDFDSGCGDIGLTDIDRLLFGSMGLLQSPRSTGESLLFFDHRIPGDDRAGVTIGYTHKDEMAGGRRQFVRCLPTPAADETSFLAARSKGNLALPSTNLDILIRQVNAGEPTLVIVSLEEDIFGDGDPSVVTIDMPDDIDFELLDAWATEDDFLVAARETSGERSGQLTLLRIPYPD